MFQNKNYSVTQRQCHLFVNSRIKKARIRSNITVFINQTVFLTEISLLFIIANQRKPNKYKIECVCCISYYNIHNAPQV